MIKLSPTSLNLFLECPRCFWLAVNKNIKRPSIPVATITTGLDKVIKEYFNLYRTKDILPPILEGKVPGKLIRNLPHKGWLEFIDNKIEARLGGDLKTHQFQMDAYTFLLDQNGLPTKKIAYLIYYIPKSVATSKAIDFEAFVSQVKTEPERVQKVFYEAVSILRQPIPSTNKDCEFCKWTSTADIR